MRINYNKVFSLLVVLSAVAAAAGAETRFTYQGRLASQGNPVTATCDFSFSLWDAATDGQAVAGPTVAGGIAVKDGLFAVPLDFGNVFGRSGLWLEIAVRASGESVFTRLAPRQALTAAPFALYALNAGAVTAQGLPPGVLTNGQTGVNLAGTFLGNGAGLTNGAPPPHWHSLEFTNNVLVCDGDSRTAGAGGYFEHLPQCLFFSNRVAGFYNVSVPGSSIEGGLARYTNVVQPHKPGPGAVAYVFEWYGINDLLTADAGAVFSNKTSYWAMARADGFKVITLTLPPGNDGYDVSVVYPRTQFGVFDVNRRRLNELVRGSSLPDGVVDVAALLPEANDPAMFRDGVHFTAEGGRLIAQAISGYLMTLGRPAGLSAGVTTNVAIAGTMLTTKGGVVMDVQWLSNADWPGFPGLAGSNYVSGNPESLLVTGAGTASANGTYQRDRTKDVTNNGVVLPGYTNIVEGTAIAYWTAYSSYVLTNGQYSDSHSLYYNDGALSAGDVVAGWSPWNYEDGVPPVPSVGYNAMTNLVTIGRFAGDGGGLTNLTHLPGYVVTNGAVSVSLSGSFAGTVSGSILLSSNGVPPAGALARFAPKPPKVLGTFYAAGFEQRGNTNFNEAWVRAIEPWWWIGACWDSRPTNWRPSGTPIATPTPAPSPGAGATRWPQTRSRCLWFQRYRCPWRRSPFRPRPVRRSPRVRMPRAGLSRMDRFTCARPGSFTSAPTTPGCRDRPAAGGGRGWARQKQAPSCASPVRGDIFVASDPHSIPSEPRRGGMGMTPARGLSAPPVPRSIG